jgi:hypothetical protein
LAPVLAGLLVAPLLGQRRGGPGGMISGVFLLGQKSVQQELKLTEEQVKKITEAGEKMRSEFGNLQGLEGDERAKKIQELREESRKTVAGILSKDQAKRFKQISLQVQGLRAVGNPEVAKELKITDDQKEKVKELQQQAGQDIRKIFEDAAGDFAAARKKIDEYNKGFNEKVLKLLTDEQKTKWKELTGKPFKGEIRFGPPPRRNNN